MNQRSILEFDLFYISYDEPQKEEFWANLQDKAPWAKRVDGVRGFDSVHKECAKQSETEHFITVDGDNIVYPSFFDIKLSLTDTIELPFSKQLIDVKEVTFSWASKNIINSLCYGNGGLKLWSRNFVLNMKTHENANTENEKIDFCWDNKYIQLNNIYSDTCPNGSPFQAFRAGFREGVKMTLDRGAKVENGKLSKFVHEKNYKRLLIWATIGADVENGLWSIYGTRLGIYMANIEQTFDISKISDYDWFKEYFNSEIISKFKGDSSQYCSKTKVYWDKQLLEKEITNLEQPLNKTLGLNLASFNQTQSLFFKSVYEPPKRSTNPLLLEI